MEDLQRKPTYEFGPFRLDGRRRVLSREGEAVALTAKAFETLLVLVERDGKVVEKSELMELLWPDSFVEESNLTQNVSVLRKALGESRGENRYIATIPGRGYQFVASVATVPERSDLVVAERTVSTIVIEETEDDVAERGRSPVARRRVLSSLVAVACLVAVALAVWAVIALRGRMAGREALSLSRLTTTGRVASAAVSPDGRFLVYAAEDGGQTAVYLRQIATGSDTQIVAPGDASCFGFTFARNGDYVYYVGSQPNSPNSLYRLPLLGGAPTKIAWDVDTAPTLGPDDSQIAFARGFPDRHEIALVVAAVDGSGEHQLATFSTYANPQGGPAWSPDGRVIVFGVGGSGGSPDLVDVVAVTVDTGEMREIAFHAWKQIGRFAWLPSGSGLLTTAADRGETTGGQVWRVAYPSGELSQLTNDLEDYSDLSLTGDGRAASVVRNDRRSSLWISAEGDVDGTRISQGGYDGLDGVAWMPNGRIVFAARENDREGLWITDRDGRTRSPLSVGPGRNSKPAASADGQYLAFVSDRSGASCIWRTNADGANPVRLTEGPVDGMPTFSPDGRWVVFTARPVGIPVLARVPVDGGKSDLLTTGICARPAVSPDGVQIACYFRDPPLSRNRIVLVPLDGGAPTTDLIVAPPLAPLVWSRGGTALRYVVTTAGVSNVWEVPIAGGAPSRVTNFSSDQIFAFDCSPDGKQFVCARGSRTRDAILVRFGE